jgi:hypothetical protein
MKIFIYPSRFWDLDGRKLVVKTVDKEEIEKRWGLEIERRRGLKLKETRVEVGDEG